MAERVHENATANNARGYTCTEVDKEKEYRSWTYVFHILFELSRVSEENRVEAQTVYKEFEIMRPKVLGAIFKILSAAMNVNVITVYTNSLSILLVFPRRQISLASP